MPGLPEIDSTLEIVAVSAIGALVIAAALAFVAGMIRALTDAPAKPEPNPYDRF